ncbi:TatD-related DNase [Phaffia rhodozyma]|uniref:TatD-related DNase n=1 Tax=Phaffia rhodozyma TaxID=264483 RepID=A0A0F7SL91_PHARH|nr:TatD-related DNase [Phaffia rhodozyma]
MCPSIDYADRPARSGELSQGPDPKLLSRLHDAHCHPTTSTPSPGSLEILKGLNVGSITAMSSDFKDQQQVVELAVGAGNRVIPSFGYHPWTTHQISLKPISPSFSKRDHYSSVFLTNKSPLLHQRLLDDLLPYLPNPTHLSSLLPGLKDNLSKFPGSQLGEVGLDKKARVPFPVEWLEAHRSDEDITNQSCTLRTSSLTKLDLESEEKEKKDMARLTRMKLTPFFTSLEHQRTILHAQMAVLKDIILSTPIDVEWGRSVSFHAVGVTSWVEDALRYWEMDVFGGDRLVWRNRVKVLIHSCGLKWQAWKPLEKEHPNIYLSLSPLLLYPTRTPTKIPRLTNLPETIECCNPDRILIESDQSNLNKSEGALWDCVLGLAEGRMGDPIEPADLAEVEASEKEDEWAERVERTIERLEKNWKVWRGEIEEVVVDKKGRRTKGKRGKIVSELIMGSDSEDEL